jgi:hypothetical protein
VVKAHTVTALEITDVDVDADTVRARPARRLAGSSR